MARIKGLKSETINFHEFLLNFHEFQKFVEICFAKLVEIHCFALRASNLFKFYFFRQRRKGFTLVELLVATSLLGVVLVAMTTLLATAIKTERKNVALTTVKRNGDYALEVMSRIIRNARGVDIVGVDPDCPGGGASITITNQDGTTTTFQLNASGQIERGDTPLTGLPTTSFLTGSETRASILQFYCTEEEGKPPLVKISFLMETATLEEDIRNYANLNFRTTVSLRTY